MIEVTVLPAVDSGIWQTASVMPPEEASSSSASGQQIIHQQENLLDVPHHDPDVRPAGLQVVALPVAARQAEHRLVHCPFEPWCEICIQSKAR